MDRINVLKKICDELSASAVYDDFMKQTSRLESPNVRIGVLGQPNSGKTSLINILLDAKLPISNLPSGISYTINFGETDLYQDASESKNVSISLANIWLKEKGIEVIEINQDIIPDETTPVELCKLISNCDVCVYMISAQAALNRTDLLVLENLNDVGVPTIAVTSRIDLIAEQDVTEVASYINSNLKNYSSIELVMPTNSISSSSSLLKSSVESLLAKANTRQTRDNFLNFYLGIALGQLYESCQTKIDNCNGKLSEIEKNADGKKVQLNEKMTEWLEVETNLRKKISDISDKLHNILDSRKEDIIRRLSHDVDVCGDVKLFWEKDFPFRLEEIMKSEMSSATQIINQELVKTMQWLQDDLLKKFRCKMSLTTGIVGDRSSLFSQDNSGVSVADTNKLKIVTRIGTAATVIAAGALFATSGIGGIIMAVSMVSGLGAEFFMRKQTNESKEQIKRHLPEIITRAQLQLVTDFNQKIQDVTNELISHLQGLKADWIESSTKSIDQEKAIAKFNFSPAKWESIMGRINQLSEIILK